MLFTEFNGRATDVFSYANIDVELAAHQNLSALEAHGEAVLPADGQNIRRPHVSQRVAWGHLALGNQVEAFAHHLNERHGRLPSLGLRFAPHHGTARRNYLLHVVRHPKFDFARRNALWDHRERERDTVVALFRNEGRHRIVLVGRDVDHIAPHADLAALILLRAARECRGNHLRMLEGRHDAVGVIHGNRDHLIDARTHQKTRGIVDGHRKVVCGLSRAVADELSRHHRISRNVGCFNGFALRG